MTSFISPSGSSGYEGSRRTWSWHTCAMNSSFILCLSLLCLTVYEIVVGLVLLEMPAEGGACQNGRTDCRAKSRFNSTAPAVWIWTVCMEYPRRSAMKCVKIQEKHLKHRCLADVSHNTSSSSYMVSCLSSIHMLMLNQAAQSGNISNRLFFFSFFKQSIYFGER